MQWCVLFLSRLLLFYSSGPSKRPNQGSQHLISIQTSGQQECSVVALTDSLERLIGYKGLREKLAENVKIHYQNKFLMENMKADITGFLKSL